MTQVFDLRGASDFLSLSPRTIRKYLPGIPHFKTEGKILFRDDELLRWLEKYRVRPVDLDEAHRVAEELTSRKRHRTDGRER